MPKVNSKLLNWVLGVLGTLIGTLIVGSIALLVKLDTRTQKLITVVEITNEHLREGMAKHSGDITANSALITHNSRRITVLEVQNEQDKKYNEKIDRLHDTVKKIEGKMEVD